MSALDEELDMADRAPNSCDVWSTAATGQANWNGAKQGAEARRRHRSASLDVAAGRQTYREIAAEFARQGVESPWGRGWGPAASIRRYLMRALHVSALRRAHFPACKLRLPLQGEAQPSRPFPERPRNMHRRTYERLRREGILAARTASRRPRRPSFAAARQIAKIVDTVRRFEFTHQKRARSDSDGILGPSSVSIATLSGSVRLTIVTYDRGKGPAP
jgi:hypothetical protein